MIGVASVPSTTIVSEPHTAAANPQPATLPARCFVLSCEQLWRCSEPIPLLLLPPLTLPPSHRRRHPPPLPHLAGRRRPGRDGRCVRNVERWWVTHAAENKEKNKLQCFPIDVARRTRTSPSTPPPPPHPPLTLTNTPVPASLPAASLQSHMGKSSLTRLMIQSGTQHRMVRCQRAAAALLLLLAPAGTPPCSLADPVALRCRHRAFCRAAARQASRGCWAG